MMGLKTLIGKNKNYSILYENIRKSDHLIVWKKFNTSGIVDKTTFGFLNTFALPHFSPTGKTLLWVYITIAAFLLPVKQKLILVLPESWFDPSASMVSHRWQSLNLLNFIKNNSPLKYLFQFHLYHFCTWTLTTTNTLWNSFAFFRSHFLKKKN